ncbi:MAG: tripartite tricarboxylate transporter substrate binding protein [Spirochaetales bacterium]|nr:tripartite tricarboxylate transporter substrate binding protein [Spirochaetales bacterium]
MKRIGLLLGFVLVSVCLFAGGGAEPSSGGSASAYPEKPIEVTCVFGAGSAADLITRKFSDLLQPILGQSLPVVNRTGGGQSIGYSHVKDQKPDGYSMIWTSNGLLTAYYQGNMDFKQEAFRSIARISYEPVSIAVKYDAPWATMEEFFQYIKNNPGKIRIGNSGVGSYTHLVAAAIENKAESKVVHVPFGQGLAFASIMGGQIEASVQLPSEVLAQHEAKQLRILALSSGERIAALPEVPTFKESKIDLEMILWRGIAVPAGTPNEIVKKLESAAKKAVESEDFKQFCAGMSIIPAFQPGAEFEKFIAEDDRLIGQLMKTIGTSKR